MLLCTGGRKRKNDIWDINRNIYYVTDGSLEVLRVGFIQELWFHFPWNSLTLPPSGG